MRSKRILERADIAELARKTLEDVIASTPKDISRYSIGVTSGTSGKGVMVAAVEFPDLYGWEAGSSATLLCSGSMSIRLRHIMQYWSRTKETRLLALDPKDFTVDLKDLLTDFAPDRIYGFPAFISRMLEGLAGVLESVRSLRISGELLSSARESYMRSRLPNARDIRMCYMVIETGFIALPTCGYLPRNCYHPRPGVSLEIVDKDEEGRGDLLISLDVSKSVRYERYRIGDVARFLPEHCRCGETVAFELLGRKGTDFVKFAGAVLRREEFDRVMALCDAYVDDYRVEASEVEDASRLRPKLTVRVYKKEGISDTQLKSVEKIILDALFVTPTRTLGGLISDDIFLPLMLISQTEPFVSKHKDSKITVI